MNKIPIADLHCDLLCYLENDARRTPFDAAVRCSIPQMQLGGVFLQVLPIFTVTETGSTAKGWGQAEAFSSLLKHLPDLVTSVRTTSDIKRVQQEGKIGLMLAIENASSLFEETEDFKIGLEALETIHNTYGRIVYISLTWNTENRFGGGNYTKVGLKEDGKKLLDFLHGRKIALDCSHMSDLLMQEALAYIDVRKLNIPLIASHSNLRSVTDVPRNLPDNLAKEILKRGGVIGLNLYRPFVGPSGVDFTAKQLEHALRLGGEKQICFGADFFCHEDLPPQFSKPPLEMFYEEVGDSSCYSYVLELWREKLKLSEQTLTDIASLNLLRFLTTLLN